MRHAKRNVPWTGGSGRGRAWEGRWGLYKDFCTYLPKGIYGAWLLFFVSARTNKRHHHIIIIITSSSSSSSRNAHLHPGSRHLRCAHAGSAIYWLLPPETRPGLPLGEDGAGLLCLDSSGHNPACPSRVPKGRAQESAYRLSPRGFAHICMYTVHGWILLQTGPMHLKCADCAMRVFGAG
jgi:hypothetical protein